MWKTKQVNLLQAPVLRKSNKYLCRIKKMRALDWNSYNCGGKKCLILRWHGYLRNKQQSRQEN